MFVIANKHFNKQIHYICIYIYVRIIDAIDGHIHEVVIRLRRYNRSQLSE